MIARELEPLWSGPTQSVAGVRHRERRAVSSECANTTATGPGHSFLRRQLRQQPAQSSATLRGGSAGRSRSIASRQPGSVPTST